MLGIILAVLLPLALLIAGAAILWVQARAPSYGRSASPGRMAGSAAAIGWLLLLLGIFSAVGLMSNVLCVLAWIVTAVVLLSLLYRYYSVERRSLLWTLMLAAEREIPLETAARVFAEERQDHIGRRALELAEFLEAGLPLALALKRARLSFPHAVLMAAELGQQTGNLGSTLRQAVGRTDESEVILRSAAERVFYLVFLVLFGLGMWTSLAAKVLPRHVMIFRDFELQLPAVTIWLVGITRFFAEYWPVTLLVAVPLLIALVRSFSYYVGYSPRYLPGLSASWHRADRSVIMRWLALAVRQKRPLPETMRLLAGYITRRGLRRKLEWAAKRIDQGDDWAECLRRADLIRKSEAAVFRSAQRAGNLPWALEEMAESSVRRSLYRFRAVINVAFPAALVAFGGVVLLITSAVLFPLFRMIQHLS